MKSSEASSKRARPLCGTLFRLEVEYAGPSAALDETIAQAFAMAEKLEQRFSRFREDSELQKLNAAPAGSSGAISRDLSELLDLAFRLESVSHGAFNPYFPETPAAPAIVLRGTRFQKDESARLDLSGIAKGRIADRLATFLTESLPGARGLVDAGGDLRFFGGSGPFRIHVRAGTPDAAVLIPLTVPWPAVCTSGLGPWHSSTHYGVSREDPITVTTLAPTATIADAATKIFLHAPKDVFEQCALQFRFRALAFDPKGRLLQNRGASEAIPKP